MSLGTFAALGEVPGPIVSTHSGPLTTPGDLTSANTVPKGTYSVSLSLIYRHRQTLIHINHVLRT